MFIYVGLDAVVGNHKKNGICVYIEVVCCEGLLLAKVCGKHAHTSGIVVLCNVIFLFGLIGNFEIDVAICL